ncbi:hypothetical protein H072_5804 [Dactylellina haptotyla CBS 200.50]|uniref:F-box domain-containing protein n=1 Tax=Dactylellina haptotyla (strain CBS 200.50) TaxID=1284197 RepID=S8AGX2_DACHA|nr:hypothetical protein H072_5804 [Dactylellina haptotyla CBS 200.50]
MPNPTRVDIFLLPELLEAVLLRVPPVLVQTKCRLVCRDWKGMIENTPALKHYSKTGLWLPDTEDGPKQFLNEPVSAFTPIAFDVLQLFWRKLEAHAVKHQDISDPYAPDRKPLIDKIGELLKKFEPICRSIDLLRPGLFCLRYTRFKKNWVTVFHPGDEMDQLRDVFLKDAEDKPLITMMEQISHDVWNSTRSCEFDYNPDGIIPKHSTGEIKAYFLFIVEYTVENEKQEQEEVKRKEKDELLRQRHRKEVRKMVEDRRRIGRERGEPQDPDEEEENEDEWEEEERKNHKELERRVGKKIFKELMRFGDYAPHRPVVVIRGTNYGYS